MNQNNQNARKTLIQLEKLTSDSIVNMFQTYNSLISLRYGNPIVVRNPLTQAVVSTTPATKNSLGVLLIDLADQSKENAVASDDDAKLTMFLSVLKALLVASGKNINDNVPVIQLS